MARYKDEQCRRCRRVGQKLFLKGERCYSDKCSISRRNYAPGQHGQKRAKLSEYGTQLREKQKTKAFYGVGEKQFRKYFEMASNKKGITGNNLLQILESRLDNVVYRLGYGSSRAQARQLVNHAQFEVNGKRVDIPSYLVKAGDVIKVRELKADNATIKANKIILPFALISIIFIFITNMSNFVPQRIFPILGNGFFKTFLLGLSNIASFDGIVFLYFLPPLLKNPADFKKISIISTIITSIYLIFTIATLLLVFSLFTKIHQISPLYNASRYIEFGTFFQRLESIFLLIWIMVFASYLSITLKFSTYIFQKITLLTDTKILIPVLGLLLFGIALLPNNLAISQYYEAHIYPILMLGISIFLSLSILIFANIFKKGVNFKK